MTRAIAIFAGTGLERRLARLARGLWLLMVFACTTAHAAAGERAPGDLYHVAPPAAWVGPVAPPVQAQRASGELSNGTWYRMLDRQIRLDAQGDDDYRHVAMQVVNAAGVDADSQIDFGVDPSYQTLILHALRVVRDGKAIDQLGSARITALPQESSLEQHIYDGGYNINVVLSDVRVGDVIEYEYTMHSTAHLYPGHYSTRIGIAWSVPVAWQRVRLLYPENRGLRYRFTSDGVAPVAAQRDGERELVFQWHDLPGTPGDDERPGWYQAWPIMEISDFADWSDVAARVSPLYRLPERPRPLLEAVLSGLRAAGGTPEQQTLHTLQYVQENIRYTSISIGRGSHTPTDPETILERRFGDCKDKSLLLSTLLQKLGIDARPALVHSERGRTLSESLPTPFAFDHAIARVHIGKTVYWLDATAYKQYSALPGLEPADFGYALPVDAGTRALELIPRPSPDAGGREVNVDIDVSKGLTEPGSFDVTTHYRGSSADSMRGSLGSKSAAQRQSEYLNYYARYYQGFKSVAAMSVDDDTAANVLTTHERYTMDAPFSKGSGDNLFLRIHTDELYRYGSALTSSVRQSPLAVDYPDKVRQVITVHLPEDWKVSDDTTRIDNPAFRYRSDVSHTGRVVKLDYEYEALADHVDPAALAQYAADRARLNNDIDYKFSRNPEVKKAEVPLALAPAPLAAALLSFGFGVWLMRYLVFRYDPAAPAVPPDAPAGINGWLLLPAINALAFPLLLLAMLRNFIQYLDSRLWLALPGAVTPAYHDAAQPAALALLIGAGLLLPFSVTLLVLFFKKRTSAPLLFTVLICTLQPYSLAVLGLVKLSGLNTAETQTSLVMEALKALLFAALWVWYMLVSGRVKATFVNRLHGLPVLPRAVDGAQAGRWSPFSQVWGRVARRTG